MLSTRISGTRGAAGVAGGGAAPDMAGRQLVPHMRMRALLCPCSSRPSTGLPATTSSVLHQDPQPAVEAAAGLQPTMMEFLHSLGLTAADTDVMLTRCPRLLTFSPQRQAAPVIEFLASLGFSQQQASATVWRFPNLLAYSIKGHLVPHTHYLKSLGVTDEQLPKLILARPHVLGTSIELVITYLRRLRIQRSNIGALLWSYPLDYSLPRLVLPHQVAFPDWDDDSSSGGESQAVAADDGSAGAAPAAGTAEAAQQPQPEQQRGQQQQHPLGSVERCSWLVLPSQQPEKGGDQPSSA